MRIALLGDIAFYGKYSTSNPEVYDYFREVSEYLSQFDYVIGNLETPFCEHCKPYGYKSAHIRSDINNVELLKFLNIDIVNLANNHMYDYGDQGYDSTKKILEENNIAYFGIENKVHHIKEENNKVALSGYCCYSTNALGYNSDDKNIGVNVLDGQQIENDLVTLHNDGLFNIVSFHAGQEHVNYPNYDHIELARKLAKRVPYLFYGHHPHVIQGIEQKNNSIIAYSLGNFCFDDVYTNKSSEPLVKQSEENKKGFILELDINNNQILSYNATTIYAGEQKMVMNIEEIDQELLQHTKFLDEEKSTYMQTRSKILTAYYDNRKKKRNFSWYFNRLNFRSVSLIYRAKMNYKKYIRCVKNYILSKGVDE